MTFEKVSLPIGGAQLAGWWVAISGHSLGSAVAVDLASNHPEAGALIIEGVVTSIADLANEIDVGSFVPVRLILTERFDAISKSALTNGQGETARVPAAAHD